MQIAFLVDSFPRSSQPFIVNQVTGLYERGCDPRVFATGRPADDDWANVPADIASRTTYTPIPYNKEKRVLQGVKLLARHAHRDPVMTGKTLNPLQFGADALSLRPLFRLAPMLGTETDILHCHFGERGRIGAILKQSGFDANLVTSIHGHGLRLAEENPAKYRTLFESCDRFLANSRNTYGRLRDLGVEDRRLVHYPVGIHVEDFPFKWADRNEPFADPVKVLTVARLENIKGIEYGLEAIRKLMTATDHTVEYHLVGDGSRRSELEDCTLELGISDHVRFHGHRPREEVVARMAASDIFLLPSVDEAFGMVLLEAQAVGLPIVATEVGGVLEAVNEPDSATLVPPRDSDAIASAMRNLLKNPDQMSAVGTAGREYVAERFDIEDLNDHLVSIYEGLLTAEE